MTIHQGTIDSANCFTRVGLRASLAHRNHNSVIESAQIYLERYRLMFKRMILGTFVLLALFGAGSASAQTCPLNGTSSNKLVCLIPQVYGPFGLGSTSDPTQSVLLTPGCTTTRTSKMISSRPLLRSTKRLGLQVSQLPTASPSSGISFHYDSSLKTFVPVDGRKPRPHHRRARRHDRAEQILPGLQLSVFRLQQHRWAGHGQDSLRPAAPAVPAAISASRALLRARIKPT